MYSVGQDVFPRIHGPGQLEILESNSAGGMSAVLATLTSFLAYACARYWINRSNCVAELATPPVAALAAALAAVPVFRGVCPAECRADFDLAVRRLGYPAGFPVHRYSIVTPLIDILPTRSRC